jgi:DNA-binding NtrC family response regulator
MNAMQQSEEQPIRVLSASVDAHLNHTRAQLLRRHGFDVITTESSEHAREQLKSAPFDVLIFGATLTRDMCWELAEVFRQSNWDGKIVEILPSVMYAAEAQVCGACAMKNCCTSTSRRWITRHLH